MLTCRLIACFDVLEGRVTKAQQFENNIDVAPAEDLARELYEEQIDEIIYSLYGLSQKDIQVIESTLNSII